MAEYIEREAVWSVLNAACVPYNRAIQKAIEDIPAADDVRAVVRGHWIKPVDNFCYQCSACGEYSNSELPNKPWNYCPNCGAKMDGERKNDEQHID